MEALGLRELRSAFAFLQDLYAIRDLEEFQTHIVTALPELVPADICSYNEINPAAGRHQFVSVPVVSSDYEPVFERYIGEHPLIAHYQKTRDGRALRISDFFSQRRLRRLGLYNEFFRPLGLRYQIAVTLPAPPPVVVGMALSRGRADFSNGEKQLLDLLRPHLIQAYRNAESMSRMRDEQTRTNRALDRLPCGIVCLTGRNRTRLINAAAARMLATYWRDQPRDQNCLPGELAQWVQHQVAATEGAHRIERPHAPLVVRRGERRLVARLLGHGDERLLTLEEETTISPQSLGPLGLTRRESEVLAWIARGKTNAEIAAVLGMSPYTVINHLRSIFDKLGVQTRTAAAACALNAVRSTTPGA
jgi:DNA-binding CsgD family transcriptional regulator